jgi:hypothetical protein
LNGLTRLTNFFELLDKNEIPHFLRHFRAESMMMSFVIVGERYKNDFFEDREELSGLSDDESV